MQQLLIKNKAFTIFCDENRKLLLECGICDDELMSTLRVNWRQMEPKEKERYKSVEAKEKEAYDAWHEKFGRCCKRSRKDKGDASNGATIEEHTNGSKSGADANAERGEMPKHKKSHQDVAPSLQQSKESGKEQKTDHQRKGGKKEKKEKSKTKKERNEKEKDEKSLSSNKEQNGKKEDTNGDAPGKEDEQKDLSKPTLLIKKYKPILLSSFN